MMGALYSAASGMKAQQLNTDVISNNLSNVNTTGYKKARAEFQDLLYRTAAEAGVPVSGGTVIPVGTQVGSGVRSVAIMRVFSQGDFVQTENPLDMVIEGDGFFQIQMPDGTRGYTRDGSFKIDRSGQILTQEGLLLIPNISLPQGIIRPNVSQEGLVTGSLNGSQVTLGQIQLVRFINPAGLTNLGHNLYGVTSASGEPIEGLPGTEGLGNVLQGFLENSNVRVVDEMVNLIVAQRAYEANSKAIQTSDEMLAMANTLKR
ncbi:MAG: flagellar basal-body rod protein FlgG [Candidatus Sericytochromatia bacterium]|nr:flagellar basal-body rod protein FlgG [Candidatus Tanganyikabacteria bacterium]